MKKIYTISISFLLLAIALLLVVYNKDALLSFFSGNNYKENLEKKTEKREYGVVSGNTDGSPFYIENPSPSYLALSKEFKSILPNGENKNPTDENLSKFYSNSFDFFNNENNSVLERSYALNMINHLYIMYGFNGKVVNLFASKYPELLKISNEARKNISSVATEDSKGIAGIMYNTGDPKDNYAAQSVIQHLNTLSFDLHNNSYAYFRNLMNKMQLSVIYYSNNKNLKEKYSTYTEYAIKDGVYNKDYFADIEKNINYFDSNKTIYKDLYLSAFEIDNMIIETYLWPKYNYEQDQNIKDALLGEILRRSSKMTEIGNYYNRNNMVFFPHSLAAINYARVYKENKNILNGRTIENANKTISYILDTNKNKSFDLWIKSMATSSNMFSRLKQISDAYPNTKEKLNLVSGNRF